MSLQKLLIPCFWLVLLLSACEKDKPCESVVCLNGGVCVNGTCDCPDGYTGPQCETYDPCHNVTCLNGGVCVYGVCDCPDGYTGPQCETYDPCHNVTCLNGGYCANGECNCPEGYGGSDCGTLLTPVTMKITKIDVLEYPMTQDDGGGWDSSDGPDMYITFNEGETCTSENYITGYQTNLTGQAVSYTLQTPLVVSNLSNYWTICLFDYDSSSADDFMAGIKFYPVNQVSSFIPSTFILSSDKMKARLHVSWTF